MAVAAIIQMFQQAVSGTISAGAQIGGAVAQYEQSKADADTLKAIGKIERENARQEGRKLAGQQRVAFAKSGVDFLGTPLEVLGETAFETELDAIRRRWVFQAAARRVRHEGKRALVSGIFGGATTLLGAGGKSASSGYSGGLFAGGGGGGGSSQVGGGSPQVGAPMSSGSGMSGMA